MSAARRNIPGATRQDRYLASPTRQVSHRRVRDSQRVKVYRAENRALGSPTAPGAMDRDAAIRWIREVQGSEWFRTSGASPEQRLAAEEWNVTITGRGSRSASAYLQCWEVRLPASFCHRWVIVHELAHLLAPPVGHGAEWVGTYLDGLVALGLTDQAATLADSFRAAGVRSSRPLREYAALTSGHLFDPAPYEGVPA